MRHAEPHLKGTEGQYSWPRPRAVGLRWPGLVTMRVMRSKNWFPGSEARAMYAKYLQPGSMCQHR